MDQKVSITKEQVQEEMKCFRRLFPIVRLLDGEKLLRRNDGMEAEPLETDAPEVCHCYDLWKHSAPCKYCIALEAVRSGSSPELTTREKHTRECFVVAEEGADQAKIENEIKTMPNYFSDYDTTVHFITEEELKRDHNRLPHGGFVLRSGKTGWNKENHHIIEYSLKLDSNPEFTSSIIVAYARAAYKMNQEGQKGCKTVFDVAPAYLSAESGADLRKKYL